MMAITMANTFTIYDNRNYDKILVSDWPSPAMIFAQIGQCNLDSMHHA